MIEGLGEIFMQQIEDAWAGSRDRSAMLLFQCPPRYTLSARDVRASFERKHAHYSGREAFY